MERQRETDGKSVAAVVALVLLLFTPVLYCLSIGPVIWLVNNTGLEPDIFEVIYTPLVLFYDTFEAVQPILDAYVDLWE
jgi:hypothetical protein